jgi:SAM-dependent methyltransferase
MTRIGTASWQGVDEGWGRLAVDFATLSEPANCREYVALQHRLGVSAPDRLLDMACGAGLAVELATALGATCAGIDASPRLVAVAADRVPAADLRVGDMNALPWDDGSFDVVTSFRGIWGTTPQAVTEALRVLTPGGRLGITVWGHIKKSPGAWALLPFTLAAAPKVANQAAMVALGRPGAGEDLLSQAGFADIERVEIPFVWEFADPAAFARALASTGPAYESIQTVGAQEFLRFATELAEARVRDGLPLRAAIDVVGYLARKPVAGTTASEQAAARRTGSRIQTAAGPASFLAEPRPSEEVQALYDGDIEDDGYIMNNSKVWGHWPTAQDQLFSLMGKTVFTAGLTFKQRGVLVSACASTMGDSYCALAWGSKLASVASAEIAVGVLQGDDSELDDTDRALARWARMVTRDPNGTARTDVQDLREAGYDETQILALTLFIALRVAFSTVNDALGSRPDRQLAEHAPWQVRDAVIWGRPVGA